MQHCTSLSPLATSDQHSVLYLMQDLFSPATQSSPTEECTLEVHLNYSVHHCSLLHCNLLDSAELYRSVLDSCTLHCTKV